MAYGAVPDGPPSPRPSGSDGGARGPLCGRSAARLGSVLVCAGLTAAAAWGPSALRSTQSPAPGATAGADGLHRLQLRRPAGKEQRLAEHARSRRLAGDAARGSPHAAVSRFLDPPADGGDGPLNSAGVYIGQLSDAVASWLDDFLGIGLRSPPDGGPRTRPAVRAAAVRSVGGTEYLADVVLGTPGREFTLVVDTGSANIWVAGASCGGVGCSSMRRYDSRLSTTAAIPQFDGYDHLRDHSFAIAYGTGECAGELLQDVMRIGVANGSVAAVRQVFGVAERVAPFFGDVAYAEGILGLGMQNIAAGRAPPLLDTMRTAGAIPARKLGIYLADAVPGAQPPHLLLGGSDPSLYQGNLHHVHYTRFHHRYLYYVIKFDGVWVGGKQVDIGCGAGDRPISGRRLTKMPYQSCHALIDSGTSYLLGPQTGISAITKALRISGCSTQSAAPLQIGIGGRLFTIPPSVYMLQHAERGECELAVQEEDQLPGLFVFGDTFFRAVYVELDNDRMRAGFAPLPHMPPATRAPHPQAPQPPAAAPQPQQQPAAQPQEHQQQQQHEHQKQQQQPQQQQPQWQQPQQQQQQQQQQQPQPQPQPQQQPAQLQPQPQQQQPQRLQQPPQPQQPLQPLQQQQQQQPPQAQSQPLLQPQQPQPAQMQQQQQQQLRGVAQQR